MKRDGRRKINMKKIEKTDEDKIKFFDELGESKLPDQFRQQILTIFQKYPAKWFTPEILAQGLDMSSAYARKCCEALTLARIVTRQSTGKRFYFRLKEDEEERSEGYN